jgi:2'-5' RNA ligase
MLDSTAPAPGEQGATARSRTGGPEGPHYDAVAIRSKQWPAGWESALLLPVPVAEPAVREYRAVLDASARDGVPAHVTVLYPFMPPALVDEPVLAALARLFTGFPAFTFTLDRVAWFGDSVVWLGPRDPDPLRDLIGRASATFPRYPRYGGQHAEVVPHLTIGDHGGLAALRAAADAVRPLLPIQACAAEVTLMAGPPPGNPAAAPGQWRRLASFPLGPRPA